MRAARLRPSLNTVLDIHLQRAFVAAFSCHHAGPILNFAKKIASSSATTQTSFHRPAKTRRLCRAAVQSPPNEERLVYSNAIPLPIGEVHLWWLEADEVGV